MRNDTWLQYSVLMNMNRFSAFTKRQKDHEEHMKDIKEATEYLHKTVIPGT